MLTKPPLKLTNQRSSEGRSVRAIPTDKYSSWLREANKEDGALMVETALSLLVIVPVVLWLFELCMLVYTYSVLGDAARQGVRYAIVRGTDSTNCSGPSSGCLDSAGSNVSNIVKNAAAYSFHNISNMSVQVTYPDGSSTPPSRVGVVIDYTYVPYVNLPGISTHLLLQAQGRIVY
jgi:Flp pilus assembly protein TadG